MEKERAVLATLALFLQLAGAYLFIALANLPEGLSVNFVVGLHILQAILLIGSCTIWLALRDWFLLIFPSLMLAMSVLQFFAL